jgi:hypothetical protein
MRKLILTILFFIICSTAHATTYYAVATGNWNGTSTWSLSSGGATQSSFPVAGDTAVFDSNTGSHTVTLTANAAAATLNMTGNTTGTLTLGNFQLTITAGATLQGDIEGTGTSGIIQVQGGGVTLAATPTTSSLPILKMTTAGQTMTSGGFTWPGSLQWDFAGTFTLSGSWITSGLTTYTLASVVNHTTSDTYTGNGGLTLTVSSGNGNAELIFNGGTLAFGANNLQSTGLIEVGGAMTSSSGGIVCAGGFTLLNTPTGTIPTISFIASQTITSGGYTWPGATKFNTATQTDTLVGNWINASTFTIAIATTINETTNETFTAQTGMTFTSGSLAGTATIILTGGTWSGNLLVSNNLTLNGNVTVAGSLQYQTGILTYTSGTITNSASLLQIQGSATLNTNGWTIPHLNILNATTTVTLNSNLQTSVLELSGNNITFAGSYNITTATFYGIVSTASKSFTFVSGQTLSVTSVLNISSNDVAAVTINSTTPSSSFNFNYTGTSSNCIVVGTIFTDVNASGSAQAIYNYGGSTLTRTSNIINVTQQNIGGLFVQ